MRNSLFSSFFFFFPFGYGNAATVKRKREREAGVGCRERDGGWGERGDYIPTIHCHHQQYFCIKMSSRGSHFNVSLTVRGKVNRPYYP